jgi:ATP-dependent helicase HrpB
MKDMLPIDAVLPDVVDALRADKRVVLQAPPGAGKTTRVPLALLQAGLCDGRIIMLEPRRLAARAAAERMAQTLGENTGETIGYRVRGDSKVSPSTKIEVVTEGILTRMIQSQPDLSGVSAIIFDEFHERSLNADLGLALCLEIAGALRPDLHLVVMSATLDAAPVAELMEASVITSQGQSFPVDIHWADRPTAPAARLENTVADTVLRATQDTDGGILVFLPGEREIRGVQAALKGRTPSEYTVRPLFGAMDFAAQRAAISPDKTTHKIVLATSIAETSLTIEDVQVVIDAGLARRARFDPGSGMSRLVTERASRAEATQRTGRAGRVAAGTCYRLWTKGEHGALPAFAPAEIEVADLAGLALELANWGAEPENLAFLTPPNQGGYAEARALLKLLGALDDAGRITAHGKALANVPLHPRLAHMLLTGGPAAAPVAAVLAERDVLKNAPVDLGLRLEAVRNPRRFKSTRSYEIRHGVMARIRQDIKRLERFVTKTCSNSDAEMVALAYPDRVGLRRAGDAPRYILSGGKGAVMPDGDPLAGARLIVAPDLDGNPREARIRSAITITETEMRACFEDRIIWHNLCEWSRRDRRVLTRQQEQFGALVLQDRIWRDAPETEVARAMLQGVREMGIVLAGAAARFAARVELVRGGGPSLPDMSPDGLMASIEHWLMPHLSGVRTAEEWKRFDLLPALRAALDWDQLQVLDRLAPAHFTTPLGRKVPIDYSTKHPEIAVKLQELFGVTQHPNIAGTPLKMTLLSPAQRPVQVTMDLPGFWASSYQDVRKDMRGRYPRHPWPEDPTVAAPTTRAKPRGT